MYRDGSLLISGCLIGLVAYGASLGLFLPDATVDFGPDQGAEGVLEVSFINEENSSLSTDEIGIDPDMPTNDKVDRIEQVPPVPDPVEVSGISDPPR